MSALNKSTRTELETVQRDAASSEGKTPQERMAMFADLLASVDAIWQHLTPEEQQRRISISDRLHRRPDPWWKNFRPEALEEYARASRESTSDE